MGHERLQKTTFRRRKLKGTAWGRTGLWDQQIYNGIDMQNQHLPYNEIAPRDWQAVLRETSTSADAFLDDEALFPNLDSASSSDEDLGEFDLYKHGLYNDR